MSQHRPDIRLASVVMQGSNRAHLVPANIKHGEFSDLVGRWKDPSQLRKGRKISSLHLSIPMLQSAFGLGMVLGKLIEPFPHTLSIYMSATPKDPECRDTAHRASIAC